MSFASLRSQVLSLENQAVNRISEYSALNQNLDGSSEASELELEDEIQALILKRENLINKLNQIAESDKSLSLVKLQQLSRHREVLIDHKKDFNRIKQQNTSNRNRLNLLSTVRSDIEEHRQRKKASLEGMSEIDYMNQERQRADNADSVTDMILDQAYRTRDEMKNQSSVLANANKKFMGTIGRMPGMNVLIQKIGTRRRRDSIIMASVITSCILIFFYLL